MKTLKESFSIWSHKAQPSALKCMPKSAVGILPHREEHQLVKLWSEMVKCEEGCRNTLNSVRKYSEKSTAFQLEEEKLFSKLKDFSQQSSEYHSAIQAMDKLLPEMHKTISTANESLDTDIGCSVREYHSLYLNVDEVRVRRDVMVVEYNRIQDKLEKLRLKGKRSTDVLVEKEKCLRQLQEVQKELVQEVTKLHKLRTCYFQFSLQTYVDTQFLQYGSAAELYNTNVVGGPAHYPNLNDVRSSTAEHLNKLKALNITDS